MAVADPLHEVLARILELATAAVRCDSCFIYVLEGEELVLRASKNPHAEVLDRLALPVGQGITGWVAEHREPVVIARKAFLDSRFRLFNELPEDRYEAFLSVPLLCRARTIGVITLQHRKPHIHTKREIQAISLIGFLVGAEIEMARLESEKTSLCEELETRRLVERAKGILQGKLKLNEEEAYLALRRESRQKRVSMKEIAEVIIRASETKNEFNRGEFSL